MIGIEDLDLGISLWARQHQTTTGLNIFSGISHLGDKPVLACMAIAGALLLGYARNIRSASIFLLVVVASGMLSDGMKLLIARDRPPAAAEMGIHNYSFPSGHSLGAAATYGLFALMLARVTAGRARKWLYVGAAASAILLVGASRLYLGVHYPTDLVGGWAGGFGLAFAGLWLDTRLASVAVPAPVPVAAEPELVSVADEIDDLSTEPATLPAVALLRGEND